jgi:hypothetical protein
MLAQKLNQARPSRNSPRPVSASERSLTFFAGPKARESQPKSPQEGKVSILLSTDASLPNILTTMTRPKTR